jgi:hypothetical protein
MTDCVETDSRPLAHSTPSGIVANERAAMASIHNDRTLLQGKLTLRRATSSAGISAQVCRTRKIVTIGIDGRKKHPGR